MSGATRKKKDFPVKICKTCKREFVWRRKWANNWEQVKYCSWRCRNYFRPKKHNTV